ncbi:PH domain-containing protein [Capnocytophaga canimorsus]|nr:PH domain-containing protein [Capnocytophaga canimorsus]WGU69002.1 PH domain-containing protein [Capnocytophaga canimorsus]WGU69892.1 PH domain-containing protein [Capnocytophaga canimorsus]
MNDLVTINQIPDYEKITLTNLHSEYKKIAHMNALIVLGIGLVLLLAIFVVFDAVEKYCAIIGILLIFVFLISYISISYRYKKYAFRQHDAVYKSGIVFQVTHIIPYVRLQHITIKQGWYAKRLGMATLCLYTASSNGDISIPGLSLQEAERWKSFLLNRIETTENEYDEL